MRRARGLPAGSENVPMVTQSLQDKQKTHICCKCLRIGSKLNWESGEEKEMAARKEVWLQVEVLQPPRERWCRCEQVGPKPLLPLRRSGEKICDGACEVNVGGIYVSKQSARAGGVSTWHPVQE